MDYYFSAAGAADAIRARELAGESHAKARSALAEAHGDTADLRRVADYIFTRHE